VVNGGGGFGCQGSPSSGRAGGGPQLPTCPRTIDDPQPIGLLSHDGRQPRLQATTAPGFSPPPGDRSRAHWISVEPSSPTGRPEPDRAPLGRTDLRGLCGVRAPALRDHPAVRSPPGRLFFMLRDGAGDDSGGEDRGARPGHASGKAARPRAAPSGARRSSFPLRPLPSVCAVRGRRPTRPGGAPLAGPLVAAAALLIDYDALTLMRNRRAALRARRLEASASPEEREELLSVRPARGPPRVAVAVTVRLLSAASTPAACRRHETSPALARSPRAGRGARRRSVSAPDGFRVPVLLAS
jgi:hypothetical protein